MLREREGFRGGDRWRGECLLRDRTKEARDRGSGTAFIKG